MYSLIFMSSCILFRIYCKNSELLRSQVQSVHKNVSVENVKKRGVFGRLMGKRVSLKKYWEYKRLEYYLYSESAKFFLWWGIALFSENCLVKKNRRKEKRKLLILRLSLRYFSKSTTA